MLNLKKSLLDHDAWEYLWDRLNLPIL